MAILGRSFDCTVVMFGCAFFCLVAVVIRPAWAQDVGAKLQVEESIGFRETIKIGKWLPVTITIRNDGPAVRGLLALELSTVSEGYAQPYITTLSQTVDLPTQSRKRFTFTVMFRDFTHPLQIRLTDHKGGVLYRHAIDLRTLKSPDRLVLALSNEPALDSLSGIAPGRAQVVYLSLEEFPTRWDALDAVDLIALRNLSLAPIRAEQWLALQQWLARGGRLLITGGPNWTHYTHPYLRELLPLKVIGMVDINGVHALGALIGMAPPPAMRLSILRTTDITGTVVAYADAEALLIGQKYGRGEITFATFDPGRTPFSSWPGTTQLWQKLFDMDETPNYWRLRRELRETFEESWIAQALQQPLLAFPSHFLLAVFLILYVSTVGVFFWRVGSERRVSRETWLLIILSVITFSASSHLLFRERHVQQDALLFEVSALDVIPQSRFADVETHLGLLSTRKHTYDLTLGRGPSTWLQIVPPMSGNLPLDWHLHQDQLLTIEDIPVPAWGLRVFKGKTVVEFPMRARVLREADSVMVRITNHTGYTLQHCWLWRGPRIVALGNLDDGDEAEGVLTVTPDELSRGSQQTRWERDLAHEMFRGREGFDFLRRAIAERAMQEVLRSDPSWQQQVVLLAWLERPLTAINVSPGHVTEQRATLVRMRLAL